MQQKHMNLVQPGPGEWPMAQWKIGGILTARVKHCDGTGETNGTNDRRVEKPWVFSGGSFLGYQNLRTAIQICKWRVAVSPLADFRWNGGIHLCQG